MTINVVVRASGLKEKRREKGFTQRSLAQAVDVTQNYIAAIEADDRRAGPDLRRKLMLALEASFDELFEVVRIDDEEGSEVALHPIQAAPARSRRAG